MLKSEEFFFIILDYFLEDVLFSRMQFLASYLNFHVENYKTDCTIYVKIESGRLSCTNLQSISIETINETVH